MTQESQSLVEHITALRSALLRCLAAVAIAFHLGMALAWRCTWWLMDWVCPPEVHRLYYFKMADAFVLQLKCALLLSLVLACPYILWQVWAFVAPGLHARERRSARAWIGCAALLFFLGVTLCIGAIMPLVVRFFFDFQSERLTALPNLSDVMGMTLWLSLAFGAMFQFPVVLLMLVRFGVVRVATLVHARPYVIVGIFILAAILTPPDVASQLALAVPSCILFEGALLIARRLERNSPPSHGNQL